MADPLFDVMMDEGLEPDLEVMEMLVGKEQAALRMEAWRFEALRREFEKESE